MAMLVYDAEDAATFIAETTCLSKETAATIIRAVEEYAVGMELLPPDFVDGVTPDALRALAPALFPRDHIEDRYVLPALERAFVALRTRIDEDLIALALHANDVYLYKLGIIAPLIPSYTPH